MMISYDFFLSISCILFCGIITIILFITNTNLYIQNKELQDKYKNKFILTIILQITLVIYLCWLLFHRIIKKDYLGFIKY